MTRARETLLSALLIAASLLTTSVPAPAQIQDRSELALALDSAAEAYAADSMVSGVSVAVVRDGDTLLLKGYGQANREFDVPTPADAVYEVGSVTKQFTAAAILQLAARDSLDLDAEITNYLPDYDTHGHTVTVRQLLHHTSGIRDYARMDRMWSIRKTDLDRDTLLALIDNRPFRFVPGTMASYSTTGYFLLGRIIEEASGQSYAEYLEEHLFGPAGMSDSRYCDERAVVERAAQGYEWQEGSGLVRRRGFNHKWPYASGSVCSTVGDLVSWNRALHGGRILSDSPYQFMVTPGRLADGTELDYGAGLIIGPIGGHRAIYHSGAIFGFRSHLRYYPTADLTIAVLQNTLAFRVRRTPSSLADSLARQVLGRGGEQPTSGPYEGDLTTFEGRYVGPQLDGVLDLRIEVSDGQLVARGLPGPTGGQGIVLHYRSGLVWTGAWAGREIEFQFVRAGERIIRLRLDIRGANYWILRRVESR